jgi:hypothetical protein
MEKNILSEQAIYYGNVLMPKGFEIDLNQLRADILQSEIEKKDIKFSKNFDKLNTFIKDHVCLKYDINLIYKSTWGNFYQPHTITEPLLQVNPVDLKHSPDFVLLYGVQVKNCFIKIYYDDNRRKGRSWEIELLNNMFIMFPSTNMYTISNNTDNLNIVNTIAYEYV